MLSKKLLKGYPRNTACIKYKIKDSVKLWYVNALAIKDTEKTLKEHFKYNLPEAEFIDYVIK